jgi:hypothetical protein
MEVVQVILLITFTQFMLVSLGLGFFALVVVIGDSVVLGWPNLAKICHFFFSALDGKFCTEIKSCWCLFVGRRYLCLFPSMQSFCHLNLAV